MKIRINFLLLICLLSCAKNSNVVSNTELFLNYFYACKAKNIPINVGQDFNTILDGLSLVDIDLSDADMTNLHIKNSIFVGVNFQKTKFNNSKIDTINAINQSNESIGLTIAEVPSIVSTFFSEQIIICISNFIKIIKNTNKMYII